MLDLKFIRENAALVQEGARLKNFNVDIPAILALDASLRVVQTEWENLQAERNKIAKSIGSSETSKDEKEELKKRSVFIKVRLEELEKDIQPKKSELHSLLLHVPQPALAEAPRGRDDRENVETRTFGTKPAFDFSPLDHVTLGEKLGILDIERGVKLAGSRSYILKGDGALLEQALLRFTYDTLLTKGFTPISVPVLVGEKAMEGTGYFPLGKDQAYLVEKDALALVGTAEVPLCAMHAGETFQEKGLPLRYMAQSSCFRREAGTYGKDTKGIYRVHQFQKIEMVIFAAADKEQSRLLHDELLSISEYLLQQMKLHYRVVAVCTGDLGQGQVLKHDIEAWMPSRAGFGETHSCSSFYDFQARRLNIGYKDKDGVRKIAYTLNNTALAAPRAILAVLENFQTKEGSIQIPECLQKYMGKKVIS
ncbi:MAG: serine--tRNA ligase [Oligoflexales bacterium]|nr:serine--tRNA ligase [Oligoflexales bacterium]